MTCELIPVNVVCPIQVSFCLLGLNKAVFFILENISGNIKFEIKADNCCDFCNSIVRMHGNMSPDLRSIERQSFQVVLFCCPNARFCSIASTIVGHYTHH